MVHFQVMAFFLGVMGLLAPSAQARDIALSIDADSCAISYALTGDIAPNCPPPNETDRLTRSVSEPGWEGYFVHFDFNSNNLTSKSRAHLSRLSGLLNGNLSDLCVKLIGHTDTVGSANYNLTLSQKRANSVRLYLAGPGTVSPARLLAEGLGEGKPLMGIPGDSGQNRRVEILARAGNNGICN